MHIDGVNSKLSDIDYLSDLELVLAAQGFSYDLQSPPYFRKNVFLQSVARQLSERNKKSLAGFRSIREFYLETLDAILQ